MHDVKKIYYSSHTQEFVTAICKIKMAYHNVKTIQRTMSDKYQIHMNDGRVLKGTDAINKISNALNVTRINANNVAIFYSVTNVFTHIETMMVSKYKYDERYKNHLFIIGYNVMNTTISHFRSLYPNRKIVVMQFEQLFKGARWDNKKCLDILKECDEIWDYDQNNIDFLKSEYNLDAKLHLLQYTPELECIPLMNKENYDIDILFYGYMNEYRNNVINTLRSALPNKNIKTCMAWGTELDSYIKRSKIVLNIHYYDTNRQEQARIFYLLCNNKCVISEISTTNYYKDLIIECDSTTLVDTCKSLLESDEWYEKSKTVTNKFKQISKYQEN